MSIDENTPRGIPSWQREPSEWEIKLSEIYGKLVLLELTQLKNLDSPILETCKKIAIYYTDRSKGISITDAELDLLRNKISEVFAPTQSLSESSNKAREVYEVLHPKAKDLPEEMTQVIFKFLEEKKLPHAAHTTSKKTKTQIYKDISLKRRILLEESRNAADKIVGNPQTKATVQKEIALAHAANGDEEGAKRTFASALAIAQQIEYPTGKVTTLKEIAKAQAASGSEKGAMDTAEQIQDPSNKATALREIAKAQAESGDVEGARITFANALTTAQLIEKPALKAIVLMEIAKAQAASGGQEGALVTARRIETPVQKALALLAIASLP